MIPTNPSTPIYLYPYPTDMRKSFAGLCGIVINAMNRKPDNGDLYVFINRSHSRMKLLWWDRFGFWLFYKMLEQGRFQMPKIDANPESLQLAYEQLLMIIEGIDLNSIKRKKRYKKH